MNWTEAVAVVFGAAAVALTIRQSLWCWPLGLVQVALYVYVFYQARLYSDMVLHVIYVVLQVYGWYRWRRGERGSALPVSYLSLTERAGWAMAIALAASVWGEAMLRYTDAAAPRADAFIAAASLAAQYLLAIKKLENWIVWIVVDVVAIAVYWGRDLRLTSGLYCVFLALCVLGLIEWRKAYERGRSGGAVEVAPV
jgi:nicotinamide mononucleotide transporter